MDSDKRADSLITERDIDSEFGLFEHEPEYAKLPDAEQQLEERYPTEDVLTENSSDDANEFQNIPDADTLSANSPIDPAAPAEEFHGTDLLNGAGIEGNESEK